MRLTCLVDNNVQPGLPLWGEHGLSFLVETDAGNVLWDTGQSGTVLAHNLRALHLDGIPLAAIALSHAHDDHTGGLEVALEMFPGTPVYAHADLFQQRYSRREQDVQSRGMRLTAEELEQRTTLHLSDDPQEIVPGVWTTGGVHHRPFPTSSSPHHLVRQGDKLLPDIYADDMSLVLLAEDRRVILLTGCCHAGLRNIVETAHKVTLDHLSVIVGGAHLAGVTLDELSAILTLLERESNPALYLNHCTGDAALFSLREALGLHVRPCPAGTVIQF